jgi:predicted nicotinamide N-methyase
MRNDPTDVTGRQTVKVGKWAFTLEAPPDLDALLDKAAAENPQAVDGIPYYAFLWPAARGLAEYLWERRAGLKGKRVTELGCGLGLPSIAAAKAGASVLATDFHADAGEWLGRNAALNGVEVGYRLLDWDAAAAGRADDAAAEWIVGSDLLYERRHIPALVSAIDRLCRGTAVIADPGRDPLDVFVTAMERIGWAFTLRPFGDIYVCVFRRGDTNGLT